MQINKDLVKYQINKTDIDLDPKSKHHVWLNKMVNRILGIGKSSKKK